MNDGGKLVEINVGYCTIRGL